MLVLLRRNPRFFLLLGAAGLALRVFYLQVLPQVAGDSFYYADVAHHLLESGSVARSSAHGAVPVASRLPGYPAFLAVVFAVFGVDRFDVVLRLQVAIDLTTCLLIAALGRRLLGDRGARGAFLLAALCPFLAQYAAALYAETLAIFLSTLALLLLVRGLDRAPGSAAFGDALLAAACLGAGIFVRVDTGLLLIGACAWLAWTALRARDPHRFALVALLASLALAPLVTWAVRNRVVFGAFRMLPPVQAQEPDENVVGVLRWMRTWLVDEISVQEVYWRLGSERVSVEALPARAFDSPDERRRTGELLAAVSVAGMVTPALDRAFSELARERTARKPLRTYATVPALRAASVWLRPRIDMLPLDPHWWRLPKPPGECLVIAVLWLANAFILVAAGIGLRRGRVRHGGLLVASIAARALFLPYALPEARYTLECFPALIVLAAGAFAPRPEDS